jgi:hypothetical protein
MRVLRRTRPSRVGCGSSAARRRLLHASGSGVEPAEDVADDLAAEAPLPSLALLIRLHQRGVVLSRTDVDRFEREWDERDDDQTPAAAGARARGR